MRRLSQCEGGSQNGLTHSTTIRSPSLSHSLRFKADFCSRPKGRQKQPLQCGITLSVSGISRCVLGRSYTWGPSTEGDPGSGDSYTQVLTEVSWVVRTLGVLPQRGTLGRATLTFQTDSSALPGQVPTSTSVRSTHTQCKTPHDVSWVVREPGSFRDHARATLAQGRGGQVPPSLTMTATRPLTEQRIRGGHLGVKLVCKNS